MIWLALLIPVITAVVLLVFFAHRTVWQEFLIPFGVSLVLIFAFKFGAEISQTKDTEFWTGWGYEARYYEDWNEYVRRTCTRQRCSGSGQNRTCTTETYDCSYVRYHPEYWAILESNGRRLHISKDKFNELVNRWDNKSFVDLRRSYHTNDGDMYKTVWGQNYETMEVLTTSHSYENRVAATNNVFEFSKVTPEEKKQYKLWDYPPIYKNHYQPSLLGVEFYHPASIRLSKMNALLGQKKQVKVFILLYKNQPLEASFKQEDLWKGGNKNELVITVGLDSEDKVQWARTFSWSDREASKVESKELVLSQQDKTIDLDEIVRGLHEIVEQKFVRKPFEDFSYIEVQPTTGQIIATFIITLLVNVGLSIFIIKNEFREGRRSGRSKYTSSGGPG